MSLNPSRTNGNPMKSVEARGGIEPPNKGFADLGLTRKSPLESGGSAGDGAGFSGPCPVMREYTRLRFERCCICGRLVLRGRMDCHLYSRHRLFEPAPDSEPPVDPTPAPSKERAG